MNTTAMYPVKGGYMVIAYKNHVFSWTITVPEYDEGMDIAAKWRTSGVIPYAANGV